MIIDELRKKDGFTPTERNIADYVLSNGYTVRGLSITELAERSYASPATVTRLCRRLGLSGYKEFRIAITAELEQGGRGASVDVNLPFSADDSLEQVAFNMANLAANSINDVLGSFDYEVVERIVEKLRRADVVNVFGEGVSATVALDFKDKMMRLGKQVNLEENSSLQPGYAFMAGKRAFNLVISHGGETPGVLECARILRSRGCYVLCVTAAPGSTAAGLADDVVVTCPAEGGVASQKIDAFASFNAVHFVLDCLYCWLYQADYDENIARGVRNMRRIAAVRDGR